MLQEQCAKLKVVSRIAEDLNLCACLGMQEVICRTSAPHAGSSIQFQNDICMTKQTLQQLEIGCLRVRTFAVVFVCMTPSFARPQPLVGVAKAASCLWKRLADARLQGCCNGLVSRTAASWVASPAKQKLLAVTIEQYTIGWSETSASKLSGSYWL